MAKGKDQNLRCPYCDKPIKKFPKRKTKCKSCGNFYYSRRTPTSKKRMIVTKEKADEIEKIWNEEHKINDVVSELSWLGGLSKKENEKIKHELKGKIRNKREFNNAVLSLFNKLIKNLSDLHKKKMAYYSLAIYFDKEGKNPFKMLQKSSRFELLFYKQQGIKNVKISSIKGCLNCAKLDGKIFSIEDAIEKLPIPNKNCEFYLFNENYPFCRCRFHPKI